MYHAASFFPEIQASSGLHFLMWSYTIVFCCINFWTYTSVSQILDLYLPCHKFRTLHILYQKLLYLFVPHQNFCDCTSGVLHLEAYTSFTSQILITNFRLIHLSNFGHKCQICACTVYTLSCM